MSETRTIARSTPKAANHGAFKHTAKPATMRKVLKTYGLKEKSFNSIRAYVFKQLNKRPAHTPK